MHLSTNEHTGARLYLAFLASIEAGQPVPQKKDDETAGRANAQVDTAQGNPDPAAPQADQIAEGKSKYAEETKQDQPPEAAIADQMVQRPVEQGDQQTEENGRQCHGGSGVEMV